VGITSAAQHILHCSTSGNTLNSSTEKLKLFFQKWI